MCIVFVPFRLSCLTVAAHLWILKSVPALETLAPQRGFALAARSCSQSAL